MRFLVLAALVLLSACGTGGPRPTPLDAPFGPASLRVFPLTRLEQDSGGRARILLHIELRDAWGDSAKGLGVLTVLLYTPVAGVAAGIEEQAASWTIDMSDPDANQFRFDPATRTYRMTLTNLPAWADEVGAGTKVRLRATFAMKDAVLRDEYVVR